MSSLQGISMYLIKAIVVLDNSGKRILSKYYGTEEYDNIASQHLFEQKLFNLTYKCDSEIALIDGHTVVYKSTNDVMFYVVGGSEENELLLNSVLVTLYRAINILLRQFVEKQSMMTNLGKVFMIVDALVDDGVLMETDPYSILGQIPDKREELQIMDMDIQQALKVAKKVFLS